MEIQEVVNSKADRVDSDINLHLQVFLAGLRKSIPLKEVVSSNLDSPDIALVQVRKAMAVVDEKLRLAKALKGMLGVDCSKKGGNLKSHEREQVELVC